MMGERNGALADREVAATHGASMTPALRVAKREKMTE